MRSRKDERGAYSDVVVCYWQIGSQRRLWRLDELVLGAGYKHCYNFYTVYEYGRGRGSKNAALCNRVSGETNLLSPLKIQLRSR